MPAVSDMWPQVTPAQLPDVLALELRAGNIPFLHGSPSTAKSANGRLFAEEYNLFYIDVRLPQMQAEDLLGFPRINSEGKIHRSEHVPFDFLPLEHTPLPKGYEGWLIGWDEANATKDDSLMAAMYKIWHERQVGPYKLHPKVMQMAMGNLVTDGAVAYDMGTAMATRVSHYVVNKCTDSLLAYARAQQWDVRITSYLEWKPSRGNDFDPERSDAQMTFACNRQWENLNNVLKVDPDVTNGPLALPVLCSKLDEGVGREFLAYCKYFQNLPTIDAIRANPSAAKVPDEPGAQYATAASLAEKMKPENIGAIAQYMQRLGGEYQVVWFRESQSRNESIMASPEMQPWKTKFAKEMMQ